MFKHNLLIIYRNFKRFKTTFFINLIGLSIGLVCTLLIYLWVNDELNVDKFHKKDDQLFQVMEHVQQADGILTRYQTSGLLAETLAREIPEVEYAASVMDNSWFPQFTLSTPGNNNVIKAGVQFADKEYFNIFSYELIQGDKNQVLSNKNSIVISEQLAMKLFNTTQHSIGKVVEWRAASFKKLAVISGVFKSVPSNSSQQFDFILPFNLYKEIRPEVLQWGNNGTNAYLILKKETNIKQFNDKIINIIKSMGVSHRIPFISPYSNRYLHGRYENGVQAGGRIEYVKFFSLLAILILGIACINFMNLATAKAVGRIKEVGIKKAIGAQRKTLIVQYLVESILMTFLSLLLALLSVAILLPHFNLLVGKQLALNFNGSFIILLLCTILFTGFVSGSYPALYLSGFNPVAVLKGKFKSSVGELWIREGLVGFQFTISVILIVAVLVMYKQMEFIQTKNLGYNKDNIIYFEREGALQENMDAFLTEAKSTPGIVNASSMGGSFTGGANNNTVSIEWEGKKANDLISFEVIDVDYDMIEMLSIKVKEGRAFSRNFGADSSKILFNEAAIKAMGLRDPIGKIVNLWGKNREIIGVTENFHFKSFHELVKPLYFTLQPHTSSILVKIAAGKERETINKLQQLYKKYNPGFPFDYKFLEESYQAQYVGENRVSVLSQYFGGLAVLISCLGLFGLAAFTAEKRRKEIGIRKIHGARIFNIIYLLAGHSTKPVFVAVVIALPLSYLITKRWLDSFAYKIELEFWYFAGAALIALFIAWLTIGYQSLKAATTNPIKSLRTE